ncbi:MAG: acetoin utilization protein AcuC, partial [Thermoplasmata archaeon]
SGFCIFNDLGVTIASALRDRWFQRIAYVDIDAHQGDGVMYGFYSDGRVLAIDLHQDGRTLFPGTGAALEKGDRDGLGLKYNIPLAPGAGDRELISIADRIVSPLVREFRPELIVLQHGVDGHAGDPLAQLQYTRVGYGHFLSVVHDLAHEVAGGRLLVTGGGGYAAGSVTRVLAEAGLRLSGQEVPGNTVPLPEGWRRDFQQRIGTEAPKEWGGGRRPRPTPTASSAFERTLEDLERVHGRSFAAP